MQQYADIYLLRSHSKRFGCHSTHVDILPKYPHNCRKTTHYKTHTYTDQRITKPTHTHNTLQNKLKQRS